ncbi:unnamed protein product [Psylliodes chrysocephalus]|uniref:CRAL-TRIO domain-containing protein n=1 Tax=Psylliodes chrysocephalus TaxID=3402493 RepID=A0A9P0CY69_9CUCU|nr:unnamed protein product [Psylliodes chrysocephala]
MIGKSYFSPYDEKIEVEVWKQHDKSRDAVKKDIEIIKNWIKTQPHLPNTLSDHQIQSFLLIGRGSVEKVKPKIDMYYTMRSRFPDVFEESHPKSKRILEAKRHMYIIPLPKLHFDLSRILIFKLKDIADPSQMDPYAIFAHLINIVEIRFFEDFCSGHVVLFDLEHCKFNHITKVSPSYIKNAYTIGERALTTRVHGIHLLNAPKYFDQVVMLVKSIVKQKMANKLNGTVSLRNIKTFLTKGSLKE